MDPERQEMIDRFVAIILEPTSVLLKMGEEDFELLYEFTKEERAYVITRVVHELSIRQIEELPEETHELRQGLARSDDVSKD